MGLRVAIVGATGNVGREMLDILDERKFPIDEVFALASSRSKGNAVQFGNKELTVEDLSEFDFSKADIALFSAGGKISGEFAPKAAKKNCIVIDNSSKFNSILTGDLSLSKRPMRRITDPLSKMNAKIFTTNGRLPIKIEGNKLTFDRKLRKTKLKLDVGPINCVDINAGIFGPANIYKKHIFNIEDDDYDKVLLCIHGRALRILLSKIIDNDLTKMDKYVHSNTGLYILEYKNCKYEILGSNLRDHLN